MARPCVALENGDDITRYQCKKVYEGDDALAYYVPRAVGCAYASMSLGPRGSLFDNSREHVRAIQLALLQFFTDDRRSWATASRGAGSV